MILRWQGDDCRRKLLDAATLVYATSPSTHLSTRQTDRTPDNHLYRLKSPLHHLQGSEAYKLPLAAAPTHKHTLKIKEPTLFYLSHSKPSSILCYLIYVECLPYHTDLWFYCYRQYFKNNPSLQNGSFGYIHIFKNIFTIVFFLLGCICNVSILTSLIIH